MFAVTIFTGETFHRSHLELFITSIIAFAATNIDDLFLLALFFSNQKYKAVSIVFGQLLGISTLIAISIFGALIGNLISQSYIGLLGFFPIYIGIRQFFPVSDEEEGAVTPQASNVMLGIALVTVANGGDNIGVYIPLFVGLGFIKIAAIVVVFLLMTLLWCSVAKYLTSHPLLKDGLSKYVHVVTPVVLILLGVYILYENHTYSLFF